MGTLANQPNPPYGDGIITTQSINFISFGVNDINNHPQWTKSFVILLWRRVVPYHWYIQLFLVDIGISIA
jgi:hypothetical protein